MARRIDIPALLSAILKEHCSRQNEQKKAYGADYDDNDLVFPNPDRSSWRPDSFTSSYFDLAGQAGLKGLRFHDLRHSHASQLLRQGVHPKIVQERLGHSSIAITMDIYSHLLPGVQQEAVQKLNQALQAAMDERTVVKLQ